MKVLLGVVIAVALGGVVWFFSMRNTSDSEEAVRDEDPQNESVSAKNEANNMMPKSSVVGSIKDAMGLGESMRCAYTFPGGDTGIASSMYVDGKKWKMSTEMAGAKTEVLFDGETQYVWTNGSTQGMKMSMTCLENLGASAKENGSTAPQTGAENYQDDFDTLQNVSCEKAGDVDFSLPVGVTFTDQCAMMEQSKKMMEQYKDQLPAGMQNQFQY